MSTRVSLAVCVLACAGSLGIAAQAPAPARPQPAAGGRRYVAIGCLSRAAPAGGAAATPQFLITDTRSDTPIIYRLEGDVSELTLHTGHMVEVAGPLSVPAPGPAARGGVAPTGVIKVASLIYLATTCKSVK